MSEEKVLTETMVEELKVLALAMGMQEESIKRMSNEQLVDAVKHMIGAASGRSTPHWKDLQTDEEREEKLAKAEAKRKRKAEKKLKAKGV